MRQVNGRGRFAYAALEARDRDDHPLCENNTDHVTGQVIRHLTELSVDQLCEGCSPDCLGGLNGVTYLLSAATPSLIGASGCGNAGLGDTERGTWQKHFRAKRHVS
jgi:hypothetical protein